MSIAIQISPGELVDRITILQIKAERIKDEAKLVHVRHELNLLVAVRDVEIKPTDKVAALSQELLQVNAELWTIEDDIREHEHRQDFGTPFIQLARSVYRKNDRRADLKKQINLLLDSTIMEEKSYAAY